MTVDAPVGRRLVSLSDVLRCVELACVTIVKGRS